MCSLDFGEIACNKCPVLLLLLYSGCVGLYVVVYMVYTSCQYVNFVWITWCMLSMLSVCLVYVVCVCSVYVHTWRMLVVRGVC